MAEAPFNSVGWIEIGTGRPEETKRFYGELFDWSFKIDDSGEMTYHEVTAPGGDGPSGGILESDGHFPDYSIFYVVVRDVADTVARAESLGGTVIVPPKKNANGLTFAQLQDSAGHHFGVFSPPAA
ncbi:VOC family protein [Actinomadura harenae]|uniref:VOC family protein n=1 Tax=Actinomadura harenae TaxID=2483351 RepID=A0A3M2M9U5_9ACTN|nr:VOC family protein [Actinomadura harenae]RMI46387.1 VOC family protein [Actinomadura harenae]